MSKIFVVGIGPGAYEQMTIKAVKALEQSDIIVGYTEYIALVQEHFKGKDFFSTPMMGEVDRCKKAIEFAEDGKTVAVVCSGDAGIYGMASLVYELNENIGVEIEVICGVTAASSGGAVLGAPLSHDFAVISLSDLLTPYEKIEKRIECAAISDLCIAIYNPSSKKRSTYLKSMCEIMLKYKSSQTVCGVVKNIGRVGESSTIMSLLELSNYEVDMFTTVYIGNSMTRIINGKMVTPRGYKNV